MWLADLFRYFPFPHPCLSYTFQEKAHWNSGRGKETYEDGEDGEKG